MKSIVYKTGSREANARSKTEAQEKRHNKSEQVAFFENAKVAAS